jgi:hypothetical protein
MSRQDIRQLADSHEKGFEVVTDVWTAAAVGSIAVASETQSPAVWAVGGVAAIMAIIGGLGRHMIFAPLHEASVTTGTPEA